MEGFIPIEIADAISAAYSTLKGIPVAIRSSATAEDLPEASFAGQQETYLNICGIDAVLDSVKKCWASLWTARAIAYRIKNNINQNTVTLAIVTMRFLPFQVMQSNAKKNWPFWPTRLSNKPSLKRDSDW